MRKLRNRLFSGLSSALRFVRMPKLSRSLLTQLLIWGGGTLFVIVVIITHSPRAGSVPFSKYSAVLTDYNGKSVRFDSFQQKPLVVFFWATWCPYCSGELTHLAALKAQYGDHIQILAVNREESPADAKSYTDALNLTGILYLLDKQDDLFKQLGGYAMPETIFVNSRGEEVLHQHGPLAPADADEAVKKIL